jgi:hypothetical protein
VDSRRLCHQKKWWTGGELNSRHRDFQSRALPTELPVHRAATERRHRLKRPPRYQTTRPVSSVRLAGDGGPRHRPSGPGDVYPNVRPAR